MRFVQIIVYVPLLLLLPLCAHSQPKAGSVRGNVVEAAARKPLPNANVALFRTSDSALVSGQSAGIDGRFTISSVDEGSYYITISYIGYTSKTIPSVTLGVNAHSVDLGAIALQESAVSLNEIVVTGDKALFNNSIDRKVYNVSQDLMSGAGSASELLQNIPSIQVDVEGNVSLRGSEGVMIMINGKSSPILERSSATVLEQLPAASIERIEVITNPSAKYKPDGSTGIINIVLKKNTGFGFNGDVAANIGNQDRYNGNIRLNYNPGSVNLYAGYGYRKDSRNRIITERRTQFDSLGMRSFYNGDTKSDAPPVSHTLSAGVEYTPSESNRVGLSSEYIHDGFLRTELQKRLFRNADGTVREEYTRNRRDDEYEDELSLTAFAEHKFAGDNHSVRLDYTASKSDEQEDNKYSQTYAIPALPAAFDNTLVKTGETRHQVTLEYSNPLSESIFFEAGYAGEFNSNDFDFVVEDFGPLTQAFVNDSSKSNHFLFDESVNAVYATYRQSFGACGIQGGLRGEYVDLRSRLVSWDSTVANTYSNLYPTLHLSYELSQLAELQLSYSRRVRRPDGHDLNPFWEYRDPRNVMTGNPRLQPEYINSIEFGCQFEFELFSIIPSVYFRDTRNRYTMVSRMVNDSIFLTTRENLSKDQSGGIECIVSANAGKLAVNASVNGFYSEIDASNLGYASGRSAVSWSGSLTMNYSLTGSTKVQMNSTYHSMRLSAQGEMRPTYMVNAGIRQELLEGRLSLIFTAADIFKTLKREIRIDTPDLQQTTVFSRDSRVFYIGASYHFGAMQKKQREERIKYDTEL